MRKKSGSGKKRPAKLKESKIDAVFSTFIRTRDNWTCQYPGCGLRVLPPTNIIQCSHFYTRGARSVRWDPDNCDAVCNRHHQFLEGRKNAEYTWWKLEQLGKKRFDALKKRYVTLRQWTPKEKESLYAEFSTHGKLQDSVETC